ncbi:Low-density lipoprotein receptor domain class A [Trichostrongylus colubriformis]|uniref:Low-density lipoprotein receptor domain class A n=1 Tax=Trichostrongylus colubriformis TaxID=6319 RepID=A0AAN8EZD7_TRICO
MTLLILSYFVVVTVLVEVRGQRRVPFRNSKEDTWDIVAAPEFAVVRPPVFRKTGQSHPPEVAREEENNTPTTNSATTDGAYVINYCDRFEFTDEILTTYGLARLEHFIYNTSCSPLFFQCSIGRTFPLRCSSEDQAFDRTTTNCNYKNAVKTCPEYDHVMHCTIRESCSDSEFACCSPPQRCLPLSMRCNGHSDCSDGDDENNCPSCSRHEFACVKSDRCISATERCDGIADDCGDGSNLDEIGCNRNTTCLGKFLCHRSIVGPSCIEWARHCDGVPHCAMAEDEAGCGDTETKYLQCENQKQHIPRTNWCDGVPHCDDGSDEKYCQ